MPFQRILSTLLSLLFASLTAIAQSSATSISFQGLLNGADDKPLPNGNYNLAFRFWDAPAPGGNAVGSPLAVQNVPVTSGVASASLPVDAAWFDGSPRYLGISINGGTQLLPRVFITAMPYALRAQSLSGYAQTLQALELRRTNATPYLYFTRSWLPVDQDYDYRIYSDVDGSDPRLVIRSDQAKDCIVIRRNGNVGIGGGYPEDTLDVNGTVRMVVCKITSDRNAKQDLQPVNVRGVLDKLATLPINTWAYTNNPSIRHIGPVAQDFSSTFAVGDDEKHIATVDSDGVALAAIQGLHQLVQEQQKALHVRDSALRELGERVQRLEQQLSRQATREVMP